MSDFRRFRRQMIVAGVGEAGQVRLASKVAAVLGPGLVHEVATEYARRAGIGGVAPGAIDVGALAPSFLELGASRAVVAGSRAALAVMRAALLSGDGASASDEGANGPGDPADRAFGANVRDRANAERR